MKFFVKSIGISSALTRGSAFVNTWKPQYLRSGDDVDEKRDSGMEIISTSGVPRSRIDRTVYDYPEEVGE